jgi:hypothetical protein
MPGDRQDETGQRLTAVRNAGGRALLALRNADKEAEQVEDENK